MKHGGNGTMGAEADRGKASESRGGIVHEKGGSEGKGKGKGK